MSGESRGGRSDELPVSCTLGPEDGSARLRRWQALRQQADPVARLDRGELIVRYAGGPGVLEELLDLAAAEQTCCCFVTWSVTTSAGQPVLRVAAPAGSPEAVAPIATMFGAEVP